MKGLLIVVGLFLVVSHKAAACLNGETRILKNGVHLYTDRDGKSAVPHGHELSDINYTRVGKELYSLWKRTKKIDYLSDYALVLTLQKKYKEAIDIYLQIERIKPGRYSTASNLGTAYELNGQNELALTWIKRAVEINPASHEHSEWIHVSILETKVNRSNPITDDFLLHTNFGSQANPVSTLSASQLQELQSALYYQLNERITFIQPKDTIVATLLFALGNIVLLSGLPEEAVIIYEKAKRYGYANPLVNERIAVAKSGNGEGLPTDRLEPAKKSSVFWFGSSGIVALLVVAWSIRSARKRRQNP